LFCISAETDVGVARLMDFIAKYGSSPFDRAKVMAFDGFGHQVEVALTRSEPVAQVFKTMNEEHFGELSFFRVYAGQVRTGWSCTTVHEALPSGLARSIYSMGAIVLRGRTAVGRHRCHGKAERHPPRQHPLLGESTCETPSARISEALSPRCKRRPEARKTKSRLGLPPCTARILHFNLRRTPNYAKLSWPRRANSISMLSRSGSVAGSTSTSIFVEPRVRFRETNNSSAEADLSPQKAVRRLWPVRRGASAHYAGGARLGHHIFRVA
jgi:hypothetical protein